MPAKEVRFHEGARSRMVHGLNILADAVKGELDQPFLPNPGPQTEALLSDAEPWSAAEPWR